MDTVIFIIIILNFAVSYYAWKNETFFKRYCLNPYKLVRNKEFDRIIMHSFLHGSWMHLIINMLVLWSFSMPLLRYIDHFFNVPAVILYLMLYFAAVIVASMHDISKHKDNMYYNSVGASGATSAIVFASIFFNPWHNLYLFGVLPVPGIVFGAFYLIYSYRMAKKAQDNIGHYAHFYGAVFGLAFFVLLQPSLLLYFFNRLFGM